jgi:polyphosphate glucokinase
VLTLGTGMGFALYTDGRYVPNIEMAHHIFQKDKTYEQRIGQRALDKIGKRRWNKRVLEVIEHLAPVFNYRVLYLGGGNSRLIRFDLPPAVRIADNISGLLGGLRLWQPHETVEISPETTIPQPPAKSPAAAKNVPSAN